MKKILFYPLCTLLAAAFTGCAQDTDGPTPPGDELVAIELSAAEGSTEVTRAVIDNTFNNVTFVVFNASDNSWLQTKTVNYGGGERFYLKRGASYKVLAVANLDSNNCPNPSLAGVTTITGLNREYIVAAGTLGAKPDKVPMISGTLADPLVAIDLSSYPLTNQEAPVGQYPSGYTKYTLPLRSLYTLIEVNVYNKINDTNSGQSATSGVTPASYYAENLPTASYIVEQGTDYAYTNTLYEESPLETSISAASGSYTFDQQANRTYNKTTFYVYTLENRRGNVALSSVNNRHDDAPSYATVINLVSTVSGMPGVVLATYIHPGKGGDPSSVYDPDEADAINNYDIDRNSIYHVNVIINGVNSVTVDTRREYLEQAVCGELENPKDGGTTEW